MSMVSAKRTLSNMTPAEAQAYYDGAKVAALTGNSNPIVSAPTDMGPKVALAYRAGHAAQIESMKLGFSIV